MPTIVYWPRGVTPGRSDALMSQVDLYASIARLVDVKVSAGEAVDSQDHLAAWLGQTREGRSYLLGESVGPMVLRTPRYKYIEGFEGWSQYAYLKSRKGIDSGFAAEAQLFDLSTDIGEQNNLAASRPDILRELKAELDRVRRAQLP